MSDVALRPGQIVQLVSGGPKMTIHLVWGDIATCKWFDVHGDLKQGDFHRKGLVGVSPEPGQKPDVDDYGASLAFGIGKALGALLTLDEILSLASDVVLKHEGRPLWPDRPLKPSKSTPDRIVRVTEDRCPSEPDVWFSWDDMPGICAVMPMHLLREAKDDRTAREDARGGRYVSEICEALQAKMTLDEILALATECYIHLAGNTGRKAESIVNGNHGSWGFKVASDIFTFDADLLKKAHGARQASVDVSDKPHAEMAPIHRLGDRDPVEGARHDVIIVDDLADKPAQQSVASISEQRFHKHALRQQGWKG